MADAFPWRRIMAIGLGVLRLPAREFWRMTLRELVAALGERTHMMDRQTLRLLMKEFPDG